MLTAAGPGLKAGIKPFAEAEGAVIQGVAAGGAVVAVEIALAVADAHPVGNQGGEPGAKQRRQRHHLIGERQLRINLAAVIALNQVMHDLVKLAHGPRMSIAAGAAGEQLQLPHPQKRWRHPGGDRRRIVDHHIGIERARPGRVPGPAHGFGPGHVEA